MDTIEIDKDKVIDLYTSSDEKSKKLLENIFGKKWFYPSVQDRIKTFEDACNELGEEHPYVIQWKTWKQTGMNIRATNAYLELCVIVTALNECWNPVFVRGELHYYPFFVFCCQEEVNRLKEEKEDNILNNPSYSIHPYGRLIYKGVNESRTIVNIANGTHLVLKSKELAEYAGKQFIDVYGKLILGR